jgi:hypothetical protein
LRIARLARHGMPTAHVTAVEIDSELLRIEIPNTFTTGHVYVYFPTLGWRFWESHPFSVVSSFSKSGSRARAVEHVRRESLAPKEAGVESEPVEQRQSEDTDQSSTRSAEQQIEMRSMLLCRPRDGATRRLLQTVRAQGGSLRLPIWLESSYHSQSLAALHHCSSLIVIAGGVGVTAVLPLLQGHTWPDAKLYWGVKHSDIIRALGTEIEMVTAKGVTVQTFVGERMNVGDVLREDVMQGGMAGHLGVVVCGPSEMADEVRVALGSFGARSKRGIVLVDEAFSW